MPRKKSQKIETPVSTSSFHESFTSFSKLPAEIRSMVWDLSISPCVTTISYNQIQNSFVSKDVSPLLLVSRETRAIALPKYEHSFGTRSEAKSTIYFNFELDTVIFDWGSFVPYYAFSFMRPEECRRFKRIQIPDKTLGSFLNNEMRQLDPFTGLEEISISGCCGNPGTNLKTLDKWLRRARREMLKEGENCAKPNLDELMPRFICLDGGDDCSKHVWFKEWNARTLMADTEGFLRKFGWTLYFRYIYDMLVL